jgi:hypothetical protein
MTTSIMQGPNRRESSPAGLLILHLSSSIHPNSTLQRNMKSTHLAAFVRRGQILAFLAADEHALLRTRARGRDGNTVGSRPGSVGWQPVRKICLHRS